MAKEPGNTDGKPDKDGPKYSAVVVFAARVSALSGKGSVTALVKSSHTGQCALLGTRNLLNKGLLPDDKYRKAPKLASDLGVSLVIGKARCVAYLAANKIQGVAGSDILADPPNSALSSGKARNSKDLSF